MDKLNKSFESINRLSKLKFEISEEQVRELINRGGKHIPKNAFLMLHRSNQLQGNLTVDELVALMNEIVKRHAEKKLL